MERKPALADLSLPDLLRQLSSDTATLVRQEVRLARVELTQKAKAAGKSAGLFAGAAALGVGAFAALTVALIAALALVVPLWGAALIVAVVYGIVAAVLALSGKKAIADVTPPIPEQAVESVRADVDAVRAGVDRGR